MKSKLFSKTLSLFLLSLSFCACTPKIHNKVEEATEQAVEPTQTQEENPNISTSTLQASEFTDLNDLQTKGMIEDLAKLGIFKDLIQGKEFKPYEPIKRSDYIIWLFTAYNKIKPESEQIRFAPPNLAAKFSDVPSTHTAYKFVQALANAGYSVGYEDGTFKPDKPITREELVAIKVGVDSGKEPGKAGIADINITWGFGDAKQIDPRYIGYIYQDNFKVSGGSGKYSRSNIMRAFGKVGIFKPKEAVLRNEAAASLWQVDEFGQATAETALKRLADAQAEQNSSK